MGARAGQSNPTKCTKWGQNNFDLTGSALTEQQQDSGPSRWAAAGGWADQGHGGVGAVQTQDAAIDIDNDPVACNTAGVPAEWTARRRHGLG